MQKVGYPRPRIIVDEGGLLENWQGLVSSTVVHGVTLTTGVRESMRGILFSPGCTG